MKLIAATLGIALLSSTALADDADLRTIHRTGSWDTAIAKTDDGLMCVTSSFGRVDGNVVGIMIKYRPSTGVFLHLIKQGWRIPKSTHLQVEIQVDNAPSQIFVGTSDGTDGLTIQPDTDDSSGESEARTLSNLLRSGNRLLVTFPDYPRESGWSGSLRGSNAELDQFVECAKAVLNVTKTHSGDTNGKIPSERGS